MASKRIRAVFLPVVAGLVICVAIIETSVTSFTKACSIFYNLYGLYNILYPNASDPGYVYLPSLCSSLITTLLYNTHENEITIDILVLVFPALIYTLEPVLR